MISHLLNAVGILRTVFDLAPLIKSHSFCCFDYSSFVSILKLLEVRFKYLINQ
jgi:hypothetical protein